MPLKREGSSFILIYDRDYIPLGGCGIFLTSENYAYSFAEKCSTKVLKVFSRIS